MRFLAEYRDGARVRQIAGAIATQLDRPLTVMEICGGQTHALLKYGLLELLPPALTLVHGPGCPVCVTPLALIDQALAIAARDEVIFTSFGDMLRVPGTRDSLLGVKARGGDVRMVYTPLDALALARAHPEREVVFFAVGFETTAPTSAMAVWQAQRLGLKNFSILCAHVLVPPAITAILEAPACRIQGFLLAGHVCTITGYHGYAPLAARFRVPLVVTGFEPVDLLSGVSALVEALRRGEPTVVNAYPRAVTREGNRQAQALMAQVFAVCDRDWRGIGTISASGLRLRSELSQFDAALRFASPSQETVDAGATHPCIAGQILLGHKKPTECAAFATTCTPEHPLGAPMVSSEGACAAYYSHRNPP